MRITQGCALALCLTLLSSSCAKSEQEAQQRPEQAGQPLDPLKTAGRMASIRGAAILGDQDAVRANVEAMQEDFRKSIKLADPARRVYRERARAETGRVPGVRSAAWADHENLLVIVAGPAQRSYDTIDAICMALEPLGDTLGVVVNLQNGAATTGDELEILSRNCQLPPGERAFMQRNRQFDVIPPDIRAQHKQQQPRGEADAAQRRREQEESLRILEASTPEM